MYLPISLGQLCTLVGPPRPVRLLGQLVPTPTGYHLRSIVGEVALQGLSRGQHAPIYTPLEVWGVLDTQALATLTVHGFQTLQEVGPRALHTLLITPQKDEPLCWPPTG